MGKMGRTPLILLIFLILFVGEVNAINLNVSHSNAKDYYIEGEYLLFTLNLTPKSSYDAKKLCNADYEFYTSLDSAGIIVEIKLKDGELILHPTPEDTYTINNGTTLKFFIPESEKCVEKFTVKVFGHVPDILSRIKNVTLMSIYLDTTKLFGKNITVVNTQKFYRDIKDFESEVCSKEDEKKLDEALLYYNDRDYWKAEKRLSEVEKSIANCRFQEQVKELEKRCDSLKDSLLDVRKDLTLVQVKLELKKDVLENYDKMKMQYFNLTSIYSEIDKSLDKAAVLIDEGKLDKAEKTLDWVEDTLTSLKTNVTTLLFQIENENGGKKTGDWVLLIIAIAGIAVASVILYILRIRRRDMW